MTKTAELLIVALLVTGMCACAGNSAGREPIVDMKGVDVAAYNQDLTECRAYADDVAAGRQVAAGAATGAVVGGVIGAVVGNSRTAAKGAGVGAVTGTLKGTGSAMAERRMVLRNCLIGRGYRVLN